MFQQSAAEYQVRQVFENTPASEAGLRVGDVITTIDEKPVAELGLISIRQMFRIEGQEYHLIVKRENENLQMVIKTKSWF